MLSRRAFLATGGATALIAVTGTLAYVRGPGEAVASEPWRRAGESFGDPRLDALAFAILAPNPHNRQPWQFELVGDDEILVTCDLSRRLEHTDPFDRQITIGFGCMLELLDMAAAEKGYATEMEFFPEGSPYPRLDAGPVARVRFVESAGRPQDPMFDSVLARRSLKEPFDTARPVSDDVLARVLAAGKGRHELGGTVAQDRVERLKDLAWRGFQIEYQTDATRRESIHLMRIGNRSVARNPDGIDLGGVPMGLLNLAGLLTHETLDREGSQAYESGIRMYGDAITSSMGFVWIKAADRSREGEIAAGRDWVRMNLVAQSQGLGIHPLSQVLQEFPEMSELYREAQDELGVSEGGVVHMLARIGYGKFPSPSPRWPLESRLIQESA